MALFFERFLASSIVLSLLLLQTAFSQQSNEAELDDFLSTAEELKAMSSELGCVKGLKNFNPLLHRKKYKVAVHAVRGKDEARADYGKIFQEYLTATAGQRFVPPIEFEVVPVASWELTAGALEEELDFFTSNPGMYSCMGLLTGAQPLVTTVSRLEVRGRVFDLDVYGGVIAARADNEAINTILDLKDKIIGAGSISFVNAAQTQFYEMVKAGMSYVMDPKQVVFTHNQDEVVEGILSGEFDVGFVRTDQLERTLDADGNAIDTSKFKVLEPKIYIMDDGQLFPFMHSTEIYPEAAVAALPHVSKDVAEEVQAALLALGEHMATGQNYLECKSSIDPADCESLQFPEAFDPKARCDTSKELAMLAVNATTKANIAGFRPPRSYFELRNMQETAGLLEKDKRGKWQCNQADSLYDSIRCPTGHYKLSHEDFDNGCEQIGLPCKKGRDCFCKPCVKAFEVDVYTFEEGTNDFHLDGNFQNQKRTHRGCSKMSLCGTVQQTREITFRVYDNLKRENPFVRIRVHVGDDSEDMEVHRVNGTYAYQFTWTERTISVGIVEVFFDEVQIPESPIRVQVIERDCDIEYRGRGKVADGAGNCVCGSGTIDLRGKCVSSAIFFIVLSIFLVMVVLGIGLWFLDRKKRQSDQMWLVNVEELHFDDPVEVIGQGSFGVVLLAEYRGTKVAIKRILNSEKKARAMRKGTNGSKDGSQEVIGSRDGGSRDGSSISGSVQHPGSIDLESQQASDDFSGDPYASTGSRSSAASGTGTYSSKNANMDFLGQLSFERKPTLMTKLFPWCFHIKDEQARLKSSILGEASGGSTKGSQSTVASIFCPWFDKKTRRKNEFILEMRLLSRLRHPCITTVMGAVISPIHEPMLVMEYMEYGSLHDLLRNETMYAGGEIILQICRDIAQGLRYLHASKPPILHGDLKAKNILIDSRFRAKVCDFGLSTKRKNGLSGTPYFMAPEYLRGRTEYNTACDIYSTGLILWEIYSRKNPYEGENPRKVLRGVCDPRRNLRPKIPETCPPKMVDVMKKAWSPDPFFRPQAKDLDILFMDMTMQDADPLDRAEQAFKARTEKASGDMLYEVFPRHIADALKKGEKVEPEDHEMVTVFFSDIVHFTDISNTISPVKVCNMLDRLYLAFDQLARKHGVFKVETIGDAYMGVTNLDKSQDDVHVKNIAEFALAAVEAAGHILIDEDDPKRGYLRIRAGFHSGPVVSNVIGSLNPRYGLFGDTVNTASRMESNSYSQKILCSSVSAKILKQQAPDIPLIKRGKINVKGKGDMSTYWVGSAAKNVGASADKAVEDGAPAVAFAPDV